MTEKRFQRVCRCEHCGSEAEMTITCRLEEEPTGPGPQGRREANPSGRVRGHAVCSRCGSEADLWLEL